MKILITGGNGYIARAMHCGLQNKHDVTSVCRKDFDLVDYNATCEWFKDRQFDVVIHTAVVGGSRLQTDTQSAIQQNLMMFYNLKANKSHFTKLINFGSGAELFHPTTPYGISKKIIADSVQEIDNWYNLRIFAVFDKNELPTRFIRSSLVRYINKEPMIIHSNKMMDFYYMDDLVNLVKLYLTGFNLPKTADCSYQEQNTLMDIAKFINTIDTYTVPILIQEDKELEFYCGHPHGCDISEIGLHLGIRETHKRLNND